MYYPAIAAGDIDADGRPDLAIGEGFVEGGHGYYVNTEKVY